MVLGITSNSRTVKVKLCVILAFVLKKKKYGLTAITVLYIATCVDKYLLQNRYIMSLYNKLYNDTYYQYLRTLHFEDHDRLIPPLYLISHIILKLKSFSTSTVVVD